MRLDVNSVAKVTFYKEGSSTVTSQQPQEPTFEEKLRELLRESIIVIQELVPICGSVDDLVGMMKLALENDGQLNLLASKLMPLTKR